MSGSNRKFGRNENRPACKRYTHEQRWIKNAARRVARHAKRVAKKAEHLAARALHPVRPALFQEPRA